MTRHTENLPTNNQGGENSKRKKRPLGIAEENNKGKKRRLLGVGFGPTNQFACETDQPKKETVINILLESMSLIQLKKYLPEIIAKLPDDIKAVFSQEKTLQSLQKAWHESWEISKDFYDIVKKQLVIGEDLPQEPSDRFLSPLNTFITK